MNELLDFVLVVFTINCVLNILVLAYFRTIIKEEKHLDELFTKMGEYFCHVHDYWHKYLKMKCMNTGNLEGGKEKGKDGLE